MTRDRLLDAWRGVGILFVITHHLFYFHFSVFRDFYVTHAVGVWQEILWNLDGVLLFFSERSGPLGVKIFFVASGYIITHLMLKEEQKNGTVSLYSFYVRRIFRILPVYLFYIASVGVFAFLGLVPLSSGDVVGALTFVCNTGVQCGWQVVHTWALAIEMQFYLIWPLVFILLPSRYRERFLIVVVCILIVLSAFEVLARGWIDNGASFACIALGALYAVSVRFRSHIENFGPASLLFGAVLILALLGLDLNFVAHMLYRAIMPIAVVTVMFFVYRFRILVESRFVALLSRLGLVSYSLYIWQQVFAAPAENYLTQSFLEYSALMIAFSLFSYFCIEKPCIRFGKMFLQNGASRVKV